MKKCIVWLPVCLVLFLFAPTTHAQVGGRDGYADRVVVADAGDGTARWSVDASTDTGFGDGVEDMASLYGLVSDVHLLGDPNGDGLTDKIIVRDNGEGVWQWMVDYSSPAAFGDGVADDVSLYGTVDPHVPMAVADLNGDGFDDRYITDVVPGTFLAFRVDLGDSGTGLMGDGAADHEYPYGGVAMQHIGAADIDGDGLADVVIDLDENQDEFPVWAADFTDPWGGIEEMGDGQPDTIQTFGALGDTLLLGDMNNDDLADRVVVQTANLTEPNWAANFTDFLGLFISGDVDIFQSASFGTVADEFLLADIIDINGTAPLQGDFDGNTVVEGADLPLWQAGFGRASGAGIGDGDADFDGDADGNDFLIWQRNLGAGAPATAAVPEPSSLLLLTTCLLGILSGGYGKLRVG